MYIHYDICTFNYYILVFKYSCSLFMYIHVSMYSNVLVCVYVCVFVRVCDMYAVYGKGV